MIVGMLQPTAAKYSSAAATSSRTPLEAKAILGYIPDRPYLVRKAHGQGIFAVHRRALQRADGGDESFGNDLLKLFELEDWAGDLIENYSHGMKQRLIHVRRAPAPAACVHVDEPMSAWTPRAHGWSSASSAAWWTTANTLFMSTHTLEVAEEVCDRIAIINHARIIAQGTMDELRQMSATDSGPNRSSSNSRRVPK
jgi:ABC-2 type transport system ATP-binding protein